MKNALFRHDDFITRRDIDRTFKALSNEEDSLKEKLVNLYILEAFLIPKQQHNHINLLHLDILDNEKIFKGYPWGRLSYILTYQFLKKSILQWQGCCIPSRIFPSFSLLGFRENTKTFQFRCWVWKKACNGRATNCNMGMFGNKWLEDSKHRHFLIWECK